MDPPVDSLVFWEKVCPLLFPQQMGWQPGAWGRIRGLFSPGTGIVFGHLGRKIKKRKKGVSSPPKATSSSVFSETCVKGLTMEEGSSGHYYVTSYPTLSTSIIHFNSPSPTLSTALSESSGVVVGGLSCKFGRCVFIFVKTGIITSLSPHQSPSTLLQK